MIRSDKLKNESAFIRPVAIGGLEFSKNIFLAPLAGVTDLPFRLLCKEQGAVFAYTEMISAKGVHYKSTNSFELAATVSEEQPVGVQIFGSEPEIMAEAAKLFAERGAPLIDVNMGCPMRKITGNGEGSALMRSPELIERIVAAVAEALAPLNVPVTVKMRRGFDSGNETCVECALAAERGGAAAITVHGRFREEYYSGKSDWTAVRRVREAVRVPVILSGDVVDAATLEAAMAVSGADGVAIGRGAMGNPWIFRILSGAGGPPSLSEREAVIEKHVCLLRQYKGDQTAASEFRKHVLWYLKGLRGSASVRDKVCKTESVDEILRIIRGYFRDLNGSGQVN